jgi:hypothetical protein
MVALVVLTPAESKKLIAKAVVRMDIVKEASKGRMIVLHPSSSTYFIVEELTGHLPETNRWACGVVSPKGLCVEMGILVGHQPPSGQRSPGDFSASWVIQDGKLTRPEKLSDILARIEPADVYVKGVNALDPQGNVGLLVGNRAEGGTFGLVMSARRKKGFKLVLPVGLEKLIPISIEQASKEAKQAVYDYGMGMAAGLLPCPDGIKIDELDAIKMLSGATAIPMASGGLGGAEGATVMLIKGSSEEVKKAINYVEQSKGSRLPELRLCNCSDCPDAGCRFPVKDKHWAVPSGNHHGR